MANQLRKGLIEPTDIPSKELPGYMGDTYRGYMVSVRERLSVFEANRNRRFGYAELDREFFALQLRMIFELTAFAVITFQQRNEPIKKNNRKKNHALDVMKLVSNYDWIQPIDQSMFLKMVILNVYFQISNRYFRKKRTLELYTANLVRCCMNNNAQEMIIRIN